MFEPFAVAREESDLAAKRKTPAPRAAKQAAAPPDHSRRFEKARSARSAEILEDYTELIAELIEEHGEARTIDIANRLGVTHPTAAKAIARLKREGLATSRPYRGVFLTEDGQAMAERVRARHRLVVRLLLAIGVPPEAAEADAEGIEHHVSTTSLAAFERFLARMK